ncbi:MAG: dihydrolipoyllysine-residue acetyltransferase [Pseudomonadota bacterium]|nr:dihydrolipoyllysine-residue acetyltransferase [Pseudomonadota bacterium]
MSERTTIRVPDIGDFKDVEIIDVLVKPGDEIALEQPLITLETDKAAMDVPSSAVGRVLSLAVKKGDRVSKGDVIAELETAAAPAAAEAPKAAQEPAAVADTAPKAAASTPARRAEAAPVAVDIRVPDLGDFKDVEVIDVLVKAGDMVELETPLITLETDKAAMDVPSSAAGRVLKVHAAKGARVNAGDVVATVEGAAAPPADFEATQKITAPPKARQDSAAPPARQTPPSMTPPGPSAARDSDFSRAHAGPSVRRFARELGVDLARVTGSGVKGRITHDDVKAFVKKALTSPSGAGAALPRVPDVDFAAFGPIEVKPVGRIQKISGSRLQAAWVNLPHVTQHDEADITELEKLRASLKDRAAGLGIKLTPLAFIARACVRVIAKFPNFNSSLDATGQNLVFKKYFHLGFAADTPNGLVVPVIRDAGRKDIYELARDLGDLAGKARAGKLTGAEMQGGCFTISSLGGIGGTAFTPIINAPEVAILGVSRSQQRPVWKEDRFEPRLMLPLSLSYDHRVIDGAEAVRFVVALAELLADPQKLVEAVP